jgi:hypothetical protein
MHAVVPKPQALCGHNHWCASTASTFKAQPTAKATTLSLGVNKALVVLKRAADVFFVGKSNGTTIAKALAQNIKRSERSGAVRNNTAAEITVGLDELGKRVSGGNAERMMFTKLGKVALRGR